MERQLIGWSYDEQVRGRQTYSVCDLTGDRSPSFEKIADLLATNWRGRKIAFVEAVASRSTSPFTRDVEEAWVIMRPAADAACVIIRGRPGDAEVTALLAAGFEYNN